MLAFALAALTASPLPAKERPRARASTDALIKPVLALKVGDAVCFSGTFNGLKVNVWDYSKAKLVPVPGLFRFGEQVTRPEPYVHVGQELITMSLLLSRDERERESWDEMHDFRLKIWLLRRPLAASGCRRMSVDADRQSTRW
jgi:hypothetical protein